MLPSAVEFMIPLQNLIMNGKKNQEDFMSKDLHD